MDLTRLYPGPLATWMFAGIGAEVIKIEHPQKLDYTRTTPPMDGKNSALFNALNRGKRSLALDLTTTDGQKAFLKLVENADIVFENFRPGTLAKSGLDYAVAKDVNPGIIYVSLTGFGQTGPYADKAGHDLNYVGYAGVLAATGERGGHPVIPGLQIADTAAGMPMAVIGALSALHARTQTGEGQHVDVSMLDACIPLLTLQLANMWAGDPNWQRGTSMLGGGLPNYRPYRCADGLYVALGTLEPKFWASFCQAINKPEWIDRLLHIQKFDSLERDLTDLFAQHPRDYWVEQTEEADCCLSPVLELDEVANNPQLAHREMIQKDHDGRLSIGFPIRFNGTPTSPLPAEGPGAGDDSDSVLRESGFSEVQIQKLKSLGIIRGVGS